MEDKLRLLLIEDNEDDALLLIHLLEKEGYQPLIHRVQNAIDMEKALDSQEWDLVICDFRLPAFSGADALEIFKQKGMDIPFILLSGTVGEEIAVGMMKAGAHDYIMKDHIKRLGPAIKRELSEAEVRRQKRMVLEELRLAKERAEESDKLKLNLLASLSHEFRTPLNGILGFAQVIESETKEPMSRGNARKIHGAGQRLMRTLDSILWMAQLNSGLQPRMCQIDLKSFLFECLQPLFEKSQKKNLTFKIDTSPNLSLFTDHDLLREALINLTENAIKFTSKGGITISAHYEESSSPENLIIQVKDTGIGILPEHISVIFEAFRQVSEGMGRQFEGCGLGLTIVKKIIELLGGELSLESRLQHGTTFTIKLPSRQLPLSQKVIDSNHESDTVSALPEKQDQDGSFPPVLVVEDNDLNKELLFIYLKNICQVDHAPDAESAIRMVKQKDYKTILMDINLGEGMDGLQATEIIRQIKGYEKTPVIAVTGYTLFGDQERLISRGCSHYLAKPFTREELIKLIAKTLHSSS